MPRTDATLETIDLFYHAAMEPELWPEALEKFAFAVGCVGMARIAITPNDITGLIVSTAMRETKVEYEREWWRHDSRVRRIFARRLSRGVCCEAQLFDDDELARDPFRQEFCRDWGLGAFAAHLVEPWPGYVVAFSAQRELKRGHFEAAELEALSRLGHHAARAATMSLKLAAADSVAGSLLDLLERFDGGVFVLNSRREVAIMNAVAERLLGDGLTIAGRRLLASAPRRQQALDALISCVFGKASKAAESDPVALPRPSGRKPLVVQAMPLRARHMLDRPEERALGPEGALVLVVDPEQADVRPHEALRLLGLTPAQARLAAAVGSGLRRRDAADRLGISEGTAREAMKHIYSRLDIRTQGELVRLVDRLAAIRKRKDGED